MSQTIRVGLIGAGAPGMSHGRGYQTAGGFKLAAVADLGLEPSEETRRLRRRLRRRPPDPEPHGAQSRGQDPSELRSDATMRFRPG